MRCLVTGATGFIGGHLVDRLCGEGHDVWALVRNPGRAAALPAGVHACPGSVEDVPACVRALAEARPDAVYHLAAQSLPVVSWREPQATHRANLMGTLHLLGAVREQAPGARVLVAGSSAEYAVDPEGRAIPEDGRLGPSSPYGVSKLAADLAAQLYGERHRLQVVRVRPFFLVGPRKTGDVCSDLARGIVAIERGAAGVLRVGNLDIVRDLLDITDGVRGLMIAAEQGRPGEVYNVCSGQGYRLRDVLEQFKAVARVPVREETDPALLRPVDEKVKIGNPSRLQALGWRVELTLAQSLQGILDYWRAQPAEAAT